jgi:hypothetical protein
VEIVLDVDGVCGCGCCIDEESVSVREFESRLSFSRASASLAHKKNLQRFWWSFWQV